MKPSPSPRRSSRRSPRIRFVFAGLLSLSAISCTPLTSQSQILARSKAEVAAREPWAEGAYIRVNDKPGTGNPYWKVSAGAYDYSGYPVYRNISVIPGSERELLFSREGVLVSYARQKSPYAPAPRPPASPVRPSK